MKGRSRRPRKRRRVRRERRRNAAWLGATVCVVSYVLVSAPAIGQGTAEALRESADQSSAEIAVGDGGMGDHEAGDLASRTRFRRVFVPAESPESWPDDGVRRLPVDRAEFAARAQEISERVASQRLGPVRVEQVAYRARAIEEKGTWKMTGSAELEVRLGQRAPSIVPLEPLSMAIDEAKWTSSNEVPIVGLWHVEGRDSSVHGVLAGRGDLLALKWRQAATTSDPRGTEFVLRLPTAVKQQFFLEAPFEYEVNVSPGTADSQFEPDEHDEGREVEAGMRRWRLCLPKASEFRIRLTTARPLPSYVVKQRARVAESYQLAPSGLDYEAVVRVETGDEQSRPLRIGLHPSLTILDVEVDGQPAEYRALSEDPSLFLVDLPSRSAAIAVRIRAGGALGLGRTWTLPGVRLHDALWIEGSASLHIDPRLELQSLALNDAELVSLTGVDSIAPQGEAYRLQAWTEEASTDIVLSERASRLKGTLVSTVDFGGGEQELTATSIWELAVQEAGIYHFAADLTNPWSIETVAVEPAEAFGEWHVESGRLHVDLRRSSTTNQKVRLTAVGRAPRPRFGDSMRVAQLDWLRARPFEHASQWLALQTTKEQIRASRTLVDAVIPHSQLDDDVSLHRLDRQMTKGATSQMVVDLQRADPESTIALVPVEVGYDVSCWTTITGQADAFQHSTDVLIEPDGGSLSDLFVVFRQALPTNAQWKCNQHDTTVTTTRESSAAASSAEVAYHVTLSRPLTAPFHLTCVYRDRGEAGAVNAPIFTDSRESRYWGLFQGKPSDYQTMAHGAVAVAAPRDAKNGSPPLLGAFRIDADDAAVPELRRKSRPLQRRDEAGRGERVEEAEGARFPAAGVIARHVDAHTLCHPDGSEQHTFRYFLEIDWATHLDLQVPNACLLQSARLGDFVVTPDSVEFDDGSRWSRFALPADQRFVTLTLSMRGHGEPLGRGTSFKTLPLPGSTFPVATWEWTAWRPDRFRLAGGSPQEQEYDGVKPLGAVDNAWGSAIDGWRTSDNLKGPPGWSAVRQQFAIKPSPIAFQSSAWASALWWVAGLAALGATAALWDVRSRWAAWGLAALVCGACMAWGGGMARGGEPAAVYYPFEWNSDKETDAFDLDSTLGALEKGANTDVYVPESLLAAWDELHYASATGGADCVVRGVAYELDLRRSPRGNGGAVDNFQQMIVRVETFVENAAITLPLRREEADWEATRVYVDGSSATPAWNAEETTCTLAAGTPGFHEIRIGLRPRIVSSGDASRFRLSVPPLPGAIVTLQLDDSVRNPTVEGAIDVNRTAATNRQRLVLGPVSELKVAWQSAPRDEASHLEVEQLSWLHIEPARGVLRLRLRLSGDGLATGRVPLVVAPYLKLLPLPSNSPIEEIEVFSGHAAPIQLKLAPDAKLPLEASLDFELERRTSTGRLEFPDAYVPGVQTVRRQFAVSMDQSLSYKVESLRGLQEIPLEEWGTTWRDKPEGVQLMYAVVQESPRWTLLARPAATSQRFRETIRVACDPSQATVEWLAEVKETGASIQMLRAALDADLSLEQVAVRDGQGETVPCRWAQSNEGEATLFLGRPLAVGDQIRLAGIAHYAEGGEFLLPRAALAVEEFAAVEMELLRHVDVATQWLEPPAEQLLRDASPLVVDGRHAAVGRFHVSRAPLKLQISAHRPQATVELATSLTQRGVATRAHIAMTVDVESGIVDRIRLNVPDDMGPSFDCTPDADIVAAPHPVEPNRQIVSILFHRDLTPLDSSTLRLSAAWTPPAAKSLRFPQVRMEDIPPTRQLVVLPHQWDGQPARWRHDRLLGIENAFDWIADVPGASLGSVFEITSAGFHAELMAFAPPSAPPRLTDQVGSVQFDSDGSWEAVVQMVVHQGGVWEAAVSLPPGTEMLRAAVDGKAEWVGEVDEARWRCSLGPPGMPRLIEVCYRSSARGGEIPALMAPQLILLDPLASDSNVHLPGPDTLWQISVPHGASIGDVRGGVPIAQSEYRRIVDSRRDQAEVNAQVAAAQLPVWETEQWSSNWQANWLVDRQTPHAAGWRRQATADRIRLTKAFPWRVVLQRMTTAIVGGLLCYLFWRKGR